MTGREGSAAGHRERVAAIERNAGRRAPNQAESCCRSPAGGGKGSTQTRQRRNPRTALGGENEATSPPSEGAGSTGPILARMAETYAVARSYEDEGEVVTVFTDIAGRRRTVKKHFATKFVRPKLFRFEYSNRAGEGEGERDLYVIWSTEGPTLSRTWWTTPEPEIEEHSLASSSEPRLESPDVRQTPFLAY